MIIRFKSTGRGPRRVSSSSFVRCKSGYETWLGSRFTFVYSTIYFCSILRLIMKNNFFAKTGLCIIVIAVFSCQRSSERLTTTPPKAGFTYTSQKAFPIMVRFTNTSVPRATGTTTYEWSFGDGQRSTSPTVVDHPYNAIAVYLAQLVQFSSNGMNDTTRVIINTSAPANGQVSQTYPGAYFSYQIYAQPYLVTFSNTSTNATSYLWNFGDGTTSTSDSVTLKHQYNPGTYNIILTASSGGQKDSTAVSLVLN